jgi:hypothetical protein
MKKIAGHPDRFTRGQFGVLQIDRRCKLQRVEIGEERSGKERFEAGIPRFPFRGLFVLRFILLMKPLA